MKNLPESIGKVYNITYLNLQGNQLKFLPKLISKLANLTVLNLADNPIVMLPKKFFVDNQPEEIYLTYNQNSLIIPKYLAKRVYLNEIKILEKYCDIRLDFWEVRWLIEEDNAEIRRLLIQVIGYEKICQKLDAIELDNWREYTLLKIDKEVDIEPIHLLKMACPSTERIHVLRVPPDITSAREAIKWVNWGIDPEEFDIET